MKRRLRLLGQAALSRGDEARVRMRAVAKVSTCAIVLLMGIGLAGCANIGGAPADATGAVSRVSAVDAPAVEV